MAQELSLCPDLSVLDNIWLGSVNVPLWNHPRARASAAALREWGVDVIDPAPDGEVITMASDDVLIQRVRDRLESPG